MKYVDVVKTGAPDAVALPAMSIKGYRVVPILGPGATTADVIAAYAPLVVRTSRNSANRQQSALVPFTVTDDVSIVDPSWQRSPGFNGMFIQAGLLGVTYRVWWAEDCYESVDTGATPWLNGMNGGIGGSSAPTPVVNSGLIGSGGSATQTRNSSSNIPIVATDGIAIPPNAKAAYFAIDSKNGAETLTGGSVQWWRYVALLGRWVKTGLVETIPTGLRSAMNVETPALAYYPGDRLYAEALLVTATGAGTTLDVACVINS